MVSVGLLGDAGVASSDFSESFYYSSLSSPFAPLSATSSLNHPMELPHKYYIWINETVAIKHHFRGISWRADFGKLSVYLFAEVVAFLLVLWTPSTFGLRHGDETTSESRGHATSGCKPSTGNGVDDLTTSVPVSLRLNITLSASCCFGSHTVLSHFVKNSFEILKIIFIRVCHSDW